MIRTKKIHLIFCLFLLFSVLTFTGTALGSIIEEDKDENEPPQIDLHEILKVQTLKIPILTGTWNIDGNLDDSFWQQAARYEITL